MNKIKFWRKLSGNKKLIFAIPQVMEMIDMLETQAKKIAELETELKITKQFLDLDDEEERTLWIDLDLATNDAK